MATQSVLGKKIPPRPHEGNQTGFDTMDCATAADYALNGVEAIGSVIIENIEGETKGNWSEDFIWHLIQGQQALTAFARQQVDMLSHELWYTHALLGDYSQETKLRAQSELDAADVLPRQAQHGGAA